MGPLHFSGRTFLILHLVRVTMRVGHTGNLRLWKLSSILTIFFRIRKSCQQQARLIWELLWVETEKITKQKFRSQICGGERESTVSWITASRVECEVWYDTFEYLLCHLTLWLWVNLFNLLEPYFHGIAVKFYRKHIYKAPKTAGTRAVALDLLISPFVLLSFCFLAKFKYSCSFNLLR